MANIYYNEPKLKSHHHHKSEHVFSIIFNIVILYVVINLLKWNFGFISQDFITAQYFIIPLLSLHIIGSIMELIYYDHPDIKHIIKIFNYVFGFANLLVLTIIFPFEFSPLNFPEFMPMFVKFILGVSAAIMAGVIITNLVRLPRFLDNLKKEKKEES
jgi:hypothetical protein